MSNKRKKPTAEEKRLKLEKRKARLNSKEYKDKALAKSITKGVTKAIPGKPTVTRWSDIDTIHETMTSTLTSVYDQVDELMNVPGLANEIKEEVHGDFMMLGERINALRTRIAVLDKDRSIKGGVVVSSEDFSEFTDLFQKYISIQAEFTDTIIEPARNIKNAIIHTPNPQTKD